jgi:hypothetical protein
MAEQPKGGGQSRASVYQNNVRLNAPNSVQRVGWPGHCTHEHKIVGFGQHFLQSLDDDRLRLTYKNGDTTQ